MARGVRQRPSQSHARDSLTHRAARVTSVPIAGVTTAAPVRMKPTWIAVGRQAVLDAANRSVANRRMIVVTPWCAATGIPASVRIACKAPGMPTPHYAVLSA